MRLLTYTRGLNYDFIRPGPPVRECFIESVHRTFRDDWPTLHWFLYQEDAQQKIDAWTNGRSSVRPRSFFGGMTL